MQPIARTLLRSGIGFAEFAQWAKRAFVHVAENDFAPEGKEQSTTRISILTGMHRKEVAQIRKELAEDSVSTPRVSANRAERVINAWLRESDYLTDEGEPKELYLSEKEIRQTKASNNAFGSSGESGSAESFESLVLRYSGDMHPTPLLEELFRVGAVERTKNNKLRLKTRGYIPTAASQSQLDIFAQSLYDLSATLDNNLNVEIDTKRFQRTVAYKHLSEKDVAEFKAFSERENEKLLQKLNQWLAERDMSLAEQQKADCQYRAGVGVYYFEELNPSNSPGVSDQSAEARQKEGERK